MRALDNATLGRINHSSGPLNRYKRELIMENFTDPAEKSIEKTIGSDLYKAGRKWLQTLDPTGEKLSGYQEGIRVACSNIKIMGMDAPRRLDRLYIALKAYKHQRKLARKPDAYPTGRIDDVTSDIARKILDASKKGEAAFRAANPVRESAGIPNGNTSGGSVPLQSDRDGRVSVENREQGRPRKEADK